MTVAEPVFVERAPLPVFPIVTLGASPVAKGLVDALVFPALASTAVVVESPVVIDGSF